jgi:hypothetical protein
VVVAPDLTVVEVTALVYGGTGLGDWAVVEAIVVVTASFSVCFTVGGVVNTISSLTVGWTTANEFGWVECAASVWGNTLVSEWGILTIFFTWISTALVLASIVCWAENFWSIAAGLTGWEALVIRSVISSVGAVVSTVGFTTVSWS